MQLGVEERDFPKLRRELITISLLVIFGLCGFLFFLAQQHNAFPEAAIDLKISRTEINSIVNEWTKKVDYSSDKSIRSLVFGGDYQAVFYLQNTLGAGKVNLLSKDLAPIWYWSGRVCKEQDQELVEVDLSPSGKLVRLEHKLPEIFSNVVF